MKNFVGIWIDSQEAFLVQLTAGEQIIHRIQSEVEFYHLRGGSRSRVPYGPQETVAERTLLKRKKQQLQYFYEEVIKASKDADALLIMGPSDTPAQLAAAFQTRPAFKAVPIDVERADSMTSNQIAAHIRRHFDVPHDWAK